jgi:hypothetical protein
MSTELSIDPELLKRLQGRVSGGKDVKKKRTATQIIKPHRNSRAMPVISPLKVESKRREGAIHSGTRYILDALSVGKSIEDVLLADTKQKVVVPILPSFSKRDEGETTEAINTIFKQRFNEDTEYSKFVRHMNDTSEDDGERPDSPGKEYDMQYMRHAIETPRFRSAVHEQLLSAHTTPVDRQKLISSMKDVEETLQREHVRRTVVNYDSDSNEIKPVVHRRKTKKNTM